MKAARFLITGCGRSGTGYTAQLLTALGLPCGHETIFSLPAVVKERVAWPKTYPGDSSWLAVPYLAELPAGTAILHQVRDPLAVVRSFSRIRFFQEQVPYREFLERHLEGLAECEPFEAALRYWDEWNAKAEEAAQIEGLAYLRYRLEDLSEELVGRILEFIGHPHDPTRVHDAVVTHPTNYNTRGDLRIDSGISWAALPECSAKSAAARRAKRYGYRLEKASAGGPE